MMLGILRWFLDLNAVPEPPPLKAGFYRFRPVDVRDKCRTRNCLCKYMEAAVADSRFSVVISQRPVVGKWLMVDGGDNATHKIVLNFCPFCGVDLDTLPEYFAYDSSQLNCAVCGGESCEHLRPDLTHNKKGEECPIPLQQLNLGAANVAGLWP